MENVILVVHLILALSLIGIVLLQRSEGGGLGMGGGGGGTGGGRASTSPMAKVTWGLAIAFIATSIALTIVAAQNSADTSVLDRIVDAPAPVSTPELPGADSLLPPASTDAPLTPQRAD